MANLGVVVFISFNCLRNKGKNMTGYQSKKAMAQDKLAQPEQEPVSHTEIFAWAERHDIQGTPTDLRGMFEDAASFKALCFTPPAAQRKPLTINEITAIEEKVYMQTTHKGKPAFEYAHALIRAVEAAHGIKETT